MTPPSERALTFRKADQAREDFAAIESDLEFVMSQLAKLPTRRDMAKRARAEAGHNLAIALVSSGLLLAKEYRSREVTQKFQREIPAPPPGRRAGVACYRKDHIPARVWRPLRGVEHAIADDPRCFG